MVTMMKDTDGISRTSGSRESRSTPIAYFLKEAEMPPEIMPVRADQCEKLASVLARAFADDPGTSYSFPDPDRRRHCLQWMFTRWIRIISSRGGAYTTTDLAGAALWMPPGAAASVPTLELLRGGFLTGFLRMTPREQFRGLKLYRDVGARTHRHLNSPHWVLDTLGVDPAHQGRGVAGALIRAATRKADETRTPCYVITHNPRNVAFYERFGFEVVEAGPLGGTDLTVTSLRRPPSRA